MNKIKRYDSKEELEFEFFKELDFEDDFLDNEISVDFKNLFLDKAILCQVIMFIDSKMLVKSNGDFKVLEGLIDFKEGDFVYLHNNYEKGSDRNFIIEILKKSVINWWNVGEWTLKLKKSYGYRTEMGDEDYKDYLLYKLNKKETLKMKKQVILNELQKEKIK